jgi:hypothetical protein
MDLALEFSMPLASLRKALTERELHAWQAYAMRYQLPTRRLELYLAQIALCVARMAGAQDVMLQDFLFDPPAEVAPATQLEAAKEAFAFNPRKKRGQ